MESASTVSDDCAVLAVHDPHEQRVPLVFASPHSGQHYTADFLAASCLPPNLLRRSEDTFVDELFACAPRLGAPLLAARFPRAFCDVNREPYELDPAMFAGRLPDYANTRSPRVIAGLGTIARVVANGTEIYRDKLPVAEIERRITGFYRPYHQRLQQLLDRTADRFGWSVLIDCHSMPSIGGPTDRDMGLSRVDVVLGDCFGAACSPAITRTAEEAFRRCGYRVVRNTPYAGGFTTRYHGRPHQGRHALQIEINRALYMDEQTHSRTNDFPVLARDLEVVATSLCDLVTEQAFR